MMTATEVRARLRFDVQRLREAAHRLDQVDLRLRDLRRRLEARAAHLSLEALDEEGDGPEGAVQLRRSQAHAVAHLARRTALQEVLRSSSPLSIIAAMAVSRFVSALKSSAASRATEATLRGHVEAGRVAHRVLGVLRPRSGIRSGVGQLTSAVVVAELVHPEDGALIEEHIEIGLDRARTARGVRTVDEAVEAASRALRVAAELLDAMADRAEPALEAILGEAESVEVRIAQDLESAADAHDSSRHRLGSRK